jgi:hypothetical protein
LTLCWLSRVELCNTPVDIQPSYDQARCAGILSTLQSETLVSVIKLSIFSESIELGVGGRQ